MGLEVGTGYSAHRNPRVAATMAVRQALERAGRGDAPALVILYATIGYKHQILVDVTRSLTQNAPLIGGSAEGVICRDGVNESNHAVHVALFFGDEVTFEVACARGLSDDAEQVGRELAAAFEGRARDAVAMFMWCDGLTINYDALIRGLHDDASFPSALPIFGGTAGDNWMFQETYQFYHDEVFSDGVVCALLAGDLEMFFAVSHGCVPIGEGHTITRANGAVIHEIDGAPALDVLREYLDVEERTDWGLALCHVAIGFETPTSLRDDYEEYVVRFFPTHDEELRTLTIPTEVDADVPVTLLRRDLARLTSANQRMLDVLAERMRGRRPQVVFHIDCAGRGKAFISEAQKDELIGGLFDHFGADVPWLGVYGFGEIAPVNGVNAYHNYTAVIAVVC